MEHDDKSLPIDTVTLAVLAEECHAYAKALRFRERQFAQSPADATEALVVVYNRVQQPEAAVGAIRVAQDRFGVELKESW